MKWRPVQQSDFTEDWQHSHYRYTDGVKLETELFELADGGLKKIGGTGFLPFSEIEILDESSTPVTREEAEDIARGKALEYVDLNDFGFDDREIYISSFLACFDWMAGRLTAPVQGYSREQMEKCFENGVSFKYKTMLPKKVDIKAAFDAFISTLPATDTKPKQDYYECPQCGDAHNMGDCNGFCSAACLQESESDTTLPATGKQDGEDSAYSEGYDTGYAAGYAEGIYDAENK